MSYRENYKLIDWSLPIARPPAPAKRPGRAFYIVPDIAPYKSPITDEVIGSRVRHRDHMREHGVIEMGNEKPRAPRRQMPTKADIVKDAVQAYQMVQQGYRPPPIGTYREEK